MWGGSKYHHNIASTPVVKLPADFIPERKLDYMKGPSRNRSCIIKIPSKFDPSILVLDEKQLCKMLHSAIQKRDTTLLYLRDERVRAVALSESKKMNGILKKKIKIQIAKFERLPQI